MKIIILLLFIISACSKNNRENDQIPQSSSTESQQPNEQSSLSETDKSNAEKFARKLITLKVLTTEAFLEEILQNNLNPTRENFKYLDGMISIQCDEVCTFNIKDQ